MAHPDSQCKFQKFVLNEQESVLALKVSPYFLLYLKNKLAVYAEAVVDQSLTYDPDPTKQVQVIVELERRRAQVGILEELLHEILDAQTDDSETPNQSTN